MASIGRNDPCPCGSGRKYKKCCLHKAAPVSLSWRKMRETERELVPLLFRHVSEHYGPEAGPEAWAEFTQQEDVPMDADLYPELDTIFIPWLLFNWIPGGAESEGVDRFPEMAVAMHYLKHARSRVDSWQRRFIEACCSQQYSFFVVTGTEPGQSLSLRDLLLRREVTVHEQQASTILQNGDIVFTRVVSMDGSSIMLGCAPTIIPPVFINKLLDIRDGLENEVGIVWNQAMLFDYDWELRSMYFNIREEVVNPAPPRVQNTDGEDLQPTKIYYRLNCTPREALDALISLTLAEVDAFIDKAEFDAQGELQAIDIPWFKEGNKMHGSWDNTVLGHLNIKADQLIIDVNSQQRAEAIRRKITRRLGKRAVFRHAVIESMDRLLEDAQAGVPANRPGAGQSSEDLSKSPEVQQALKEMGERHWRDWLDMPLPVLKGLTPRQAAGSESGRERLEALFLQFARPGRPPEPFDPDLDGLRRELGMN